MHPSGLTSLTRLSPGKGEPDCPVRVSTGEYRADTAGGHGLPALWPRGGLTAEDLPRPVMAPAKPGGDLPIFC
ncbi:hypothetical protein EMIT051CA3_20937 [Pseudomonas chlororaphis]